MDTRGVILDPVIRIDMMLLTISNGFLHMSAKLMAIYKRFQRPMLHVDFGLLNLCPVQGLVF